MYSLGVCVSGMPYVAFVLILYVQCPYFESQVRVTPRLSYGHHNILFCCDLVLSGPSEPCEREGKRTTVAVVSLIILLVCGAALAFLLWRYGNTH